MKFGMESEKILYDLKNHQVCHTAQRTLQALEDYRLLYGHEPVARVEGEFVHNMIEMTSSPHEDTLEVAKDYLVSYQLVREACARTQTVLVPFGSFPLAFHPQMVTQWKYYVKNAILSKNVDVGWSLEPNQTLYDAANCAGVHIHAEIETLPEYLTFTRELMDKHNLATSLIPFNAFSSSPYFAGKTEAKSMRALRYYFGCYREYPQFGGIPPIVRSSAELLGFYQESMRDWENRGVALGFEPEEVHRIAMRDGFFWGMVRWNRKWNTVELRFLDTDLIGMDLAKFTVLSSILRRLDLNGERLHTRILSVRESALQDRDPAALDRMIEERMSEVLEISGKDLSIFPSPLLERLIRLSIQDGLGNRLVSSYVEKILALSRTHLGPTEQWISAPVFQAFSDGVTTSDRILKNLNRKKTLRKEDVDSLLQEFLTTENVQFERLKEALPVEWKLHSHSAYAPSSAIPTPILKRATEKKQSGFGLGL